MTKCKCKCYPLKQLYWSSEKQLNWSSKSKLYTISCQLAQLAQLAIIYTLVSMPFPLFQNSSHSELYSHTPQHISYALVQNALQPPKHFILHPKVTHATITVA